MSGFKLLLIQIETLLKSVNTSACINQLLLAGVEGVALRADFNLDVFLSRQSLDHVTAVAGNSGLEQCRMDTLFHDFHLFDNICKPCSPSVALDSSDVYTLQLLIISLISDIVKHF